MIQVLPQHIVDVFLIVCHDKDHIIERGITIDKLQDFEDLLSRETVKVINNHVYPFTKGRDSFIDSLPILLGE